MQLGLLMGEGGTDTCPPMEIMGRGVNHDPATLLLHLYDLSIAPSPPQKINFAYDGEKKRKFNFNEGAIA